MLNLVVPCPGSKVSPGDATEDGKALAALAAGIAGRQRKPVRRPAPSCHDTAKMVATQRAPSGRTATGFSIGIPRFRFAEVKGHLGRLSSVSARYSGNYAAVQ